MKNIELVLFDLDGVLVDACDWHYMALNKALEEKIGITISREDHENKYNGLPTAVKLKMLGVSEEKSKEINKLKQNITLEIIKQNVSIMEEKIELHEYLKSNNIKIGCVTNSIAETAKIMLEKTGQLKYMDVIISNEMVKNNKPNPEPYNYAIQYLNSNPSNCLCVEDSEIGIKAAKESLAKYVWKVKSSKEVNKKNYLKCINGEIMCKY